jgi:hypothetical protein
MMSLIFSTNALPCGQFSPSLQDLPPVGRYETWHAIGKQPLSNFKTLPAFGFGSSSFDKESKRFLTLDHTKEWKV